MRHPPTCDARARGEAGVLPAYGFTRPHGRRAGLAQAVRRDGRGGVKAGAKAADGVSTIAIDQNEQPMVVLANSSPNR